MIGMFGRPIAQVVQAARPEITIDVLPALLETAPASEDAPEPLSRSA